jgi:hypothetical protein
MADVDDMVLASVRKHLANRRRDIQDKFPKNLPADEYHRHCGRFEEMERFESALMDALRTANAQANQGDDDEPDST